MIDAQIVIRPKSEIEQRVSDLGKQATQLSTTDVEQAIACLREVQILLPQAECSYSVETYLRLPKYLYKNKQYDDAILELQKLIDGLSERMLEETTRSPTDDDSYFQLKYNKNYHGQLVVIYELMLKFHTKENNIEQIDACKDILKTVRRKATYYTNKLDKEREQRLDEHKQRLENRQKEREIKAQQILEEHQHDTPKSLHENQVQQIATQNPMGRQNMSSVRKSTVQPKQKEYSELQLWVAIAMVIGCIIICSYIVLSG